MEVFLTLNMRNTEKQMMETIQRLKWRYFYFTFLPNLSTAGFSPTKSFSCRLSLREAALPANASSLPHSGAAALTLNRNLIEKLSLFLLYLCLSVSFWKVEASLPPPLLASHQGWGKRDIKHAYGLHIMEHTHTPLFS